MQTLDRPHGWRELFPDILIRFGGEHDNIAFIGKHWGRINAAFQGNKVAAQDRIHVLAIQPDDEVLSILIIHGDTFICSNQDLI